MDTLTVIVKPDTDLQRFLDRQDIVLILGKSRAINTAHRNFRDRRV